MKRDDPHGLWSAAHLRASLERTLRSQHALRLHAALLLLWTFCVGLIATKTLLAYGLETMWVRYAFTVSVSYVAFLIGLRVWLFCTGIGSNRRRRRFGSSVDLPSGSSGSSDSAPPVAGGGGHFGGGGASSDYAVDSSLPLEAGDAPASSSVELPNLSHVDGFDVGEGFLVIAVAAILLAVLAGVVFVIWEATPLVFVDAAFDALLAAGLVRTLKSERRADWMSATFRKTLFPFLIVMNLALGFALFAHRYAPQAHTLGDVIDVARKHQLRR